MADALVGTWRFESSTNDEQIAQILSFPVEKWNEIKEAKPEVTFTKIDGTKYHVKSVNKMSTQELDITLGEEVTSKFPLPDGKEGQVKVTLTKVDDNTWREIHDYGVASVDMTRKIDGDTMTTTFSCKEISGTAVYKKV